MRKLFIFLSILSMASAASAAPYFQVDPADIKDYFYPGDVITINIVDDGPVVSILVDAITDNCAGGQAMEPITYNPNFSAAMPGTIVNDPCSCILIQYIGLGSTIPVVPATGVLHSFEYQVPDVQAPFIEIGSYADGDYYLLPQVVYDDGSSYEGHVGSVMIGTSYAICTVPDVVNLPEADAIAAIEAAGLIYGWTTNGKSDTIPIGNVMSQDPPALTEVDCGSEVYIQVVCQRATCGTCLGDYDGDGWVRINDLTALSVLLSIPPYRWIRDDCNYNPCCDINGDNWMRIPDYTAMSNYINTLANYRCSCATCGPW